MEAGHTDSSCSSPEKFVKLKNFDFKNNKVFQDGWRKIKDVIPQEQMFESLVKAQVFFFSSFSWTLYEPRQEKTRFLPMRNKREFESVNLEEYEKWLEDQDTDREEYLKNQVPNNDDKNDVENLSTETATANPDNTCIHAGKHPESFAELIEMIQSGLKLPDTEGPEIEPINDVPSAAIIERKKKPWEDT